MRPRAGSNRNSFQDNINFEFATASWNMGLVLLSLTFVKEPVCGRPLP